MDMYDIRFIIYQNLDIQNLKSCFNIDHLSTMINTPYFWKLYYEKHDIKVPLINYNYYKAYDTSIKSKNIIKKFNPGQVLFIELNNIISNIFENEHDNIALNNFMKFKIELPFFYELRIIQNNNSFNFFCVVIEICYEGVKRGFEALDITIDNISYLYNVIFKMIYADVINNTKFYTF